MKMMLHLIYETYADKFREIVRQNPNKQAIHV